MQPTQCNLCRNPSQPHLAINNLKGLILAQNSYNFFKLTKFCPHAQGLFCISWILPVQASRLKTSTRVPKQYPIFIGILILGVFV